MKGWTNVWSFSDQYQIFSHRRVAIFSYQWCSACARNSAIVNLVGTFLGIRQPPSQMPQTKQSAKLLDLSREFYLSVNVGTVFLCLVMSKREIKRSLILKCHKIIAGFFCGIFLENWQDNSTSQRFIILHMEFTIVPYCTTSFSGCSTSVARIFQKEGGGGGHTVSNKGYSPDCGVFAT